MVITVGKPERVDRIGAASNAMREYFPDDSPFEGVGVAPDVEIHTSALDLRRGNDPVMAKAVAMIAEGKNEAAKALENTARAQRRPWIMRISHELENRLRQIPIFTKLAEAVKDGTFKVKAPYDFAYDGVFSSFHGDC